MTEAEWFTTGDTREMLSWLCSQYGAHKQRRSRRKLRLFGCACCREQWEAMTDPRSRAAVEFMELLADGATARHGIHESKRAARSVCDEHEWDPENPDQDFAVFALAERHAYRRAAENAYRLLAEDVRECAYSDCAVRMTVYDPAEEVTRWRARLKFVSEYLRDIFGNPFRPVAFDPAWRTEHTIGLAARMQETGDFAALPILADALEEAGCENADILSHCREPGVHVRGCWVVDLVLAKG